ncbi:MAG: O-antigen ligase family protein [Candidatus Eisenbacteria bacterium]|nr:O-antigen ligase family protein [Candidatus Eisenbacteria bacterium]
MTTGPRTAAGTPVQEVRAAARRQARTLSGGLAVTLGVVLAFLLVVAFVLLDYRFDQDPHRLVKILLGGAVFGGILLQPRLGLFVLPVATPFLPWMPRIPLPGINVLNVLLLSVFLPWAVARVLRREPLFRPNRLGGTLLAIVALAALSIVRGAAFPTGYLYDGGDAALQLFRSAMTFAVYFIALTMARGERDRRRYAWALVIGLLVESVVTIAYGRNGRGARALGSFGQSNDLGAFVAMFTVFVAAQLPAARNWLARAVLAAGMVAGAAATVLSVSRGAVIALAVGLLYVGLRSSRLLTALLVLAAVGWPLWAPDYLKERMAGTTVEVEGSDAVALEGAAQTRVDTWKAIVKVVSEHPVEGVGFAGLGYVLPGVGEELGIEVKDSSHNTFLRFLSELGIFGLLLFLVLLWRCWKLSQDGLRAARSPFDRQLAVGLGAATLALVISCAFGDRFFNILITGNFWLACALVNDLLLERQREAA